MNTNHEEFAVSSEDLLSVVDDLVYHFDEPFADAASLPVYLISRQARRSVKVTLSGEGGDELFGGYRRYAADYWGASFARLPGAMRWAAASAISRFGSGSPLHRAARSLAIRDPAERYAMWLRVFPEDTLRRIVKNEDAQAELDCYEGAAEYRRLFRLYGKSCRLERMLYADAQTWLPDTYLEKVDKASMAVSLEVRVPLLDLEVVRLAASCPRSLKLRRMWACPDSVDTCVMLRAPSPRSAARRPRG